MQLLEGHAGGVRRASERYDAGIACAVYYEDFTPGIHLPSALVARIGTLGLWVDFDLYFLGEDDPEE